jgi:penicillin V acylase-like amidase (Ntn superfamily)
MFLRCMLIILCVFSSFSFSCTAVSYRQGKFVASARTFDWPDGRVFFVVSPKGQQRRALSIAKGSRPMHWTSRLGSVLITMAKGDKPNMAAVVDGMNTQGLSAALLYLSATKYPTYAKHTAVVGSTQWVEYVVDHFATVAQAVAGVKKLPVVASIYEKKVVPAHFVVTDKAGHSAVFEYVKGHLHISERVDMPIPVLSNTSYPKALHLNFLAQTDKRYKTMSSGSGSLARFIRAARAVSELPKVSTKEAVHSELFGVMAGSAEPLGTPWPTQWTVVRDNQQQIYYWRSAYRQQIQKLALSSLDLTSGAPVSWFRLAKFHQPS